MRRGRRRCGRCSKKRVLASSCGAAADVGRTLLLLAASSSSCSSENRVRDPAPSRRPPNFHAPPGVHHAEARPGIEAPEPCRPVVRRRQRRAPVGGGPHGREPSPVPFEDVGAGPRPQLPDAGSAVVRRREGSADGVGRRRSSSSPSWNRGSRRHEGDGNDPARVAGKDRLRPQPAHVPRDGAFPQCGVRL